MKIMSFNIKHEIIEDLLWLWRKRYKRVVNFIKEENPDIIGVQELTRKSKKYLTKKLKDYYIIGDSRKSKFPTNEYNCLIIKKDYEIKSFETYSLSNNINVLGTTSESDNYPRICVTAHIKKDKNNYLIINTHIDNSSSDNKKRMLDILERIIEIEKNNDEYVIILGDYNMTIDNKSLLRFSKGYKAPFKDYKIGSFPSLPNLKSLDHIFIDKKLDYSNDKIYTDSNERGYMSDHNPISCEIVENKHI